MRTVKLEEMNTRSFAESGYDTAIVPIGACESHGDHMPFGTDGLTSHALAVRIAEQCEKTFVLPAYYLGMSTHYRHKPINVTLTNETQIRVLTEVLESLHHWGIRKVLILNGHDGNIPCAEIAARDVKVRHPEMSLGVFDWWTILAQMLPSDTFEVWSGWGHAGEVETSIGLALSPSSCTWSTRAARSPPGSIRSSRRSGPSTRSPATAPAARRRRGRPRRAR
jgi:creatinine amidohydrolase